MTNYGWNFRRRQGGCFSLTHSGRVNRVIPDTLIVFVTYYLLTHSAQTSKFSSAQFGLVLSFCRAVQNIFRYLKPFRRDSTSVSDRQTDRHYSSICRASLCFAAKTKYIIWTSDLPGTAFTDRGVLLSSMPFTNFPDPLLARMCNNKNWCYSLMRMSRVTGHRIATIFCRYPIPDDYCWEKVKRLLPVISTYIYQFWSIYLNI